jgi:hypothetical protein
MNLWGGEGKEIYPPGDFLCHEATQEGAYCISECNDGADDALVLSPETIL